MVEHGCHGASKPLQITLLRQTADTLERAPRRRAGEVLMTFGSTFQQLEQARQLLEREPE